MSQRWRALGVLTICMAVATTGDTVTVSAQPGDGTTPGELYGIVRLGPRLAGRRVRFNLYPDPGPVAPVSAPHSLTDELANVVVYFESAASLTGAGEPRPGPFRMEQSRETFLPHVLPVMAGATVEFPNGDPIYHNVFSLSKASSFDLGRYPKGSSRTIRFDRTGIVKVFCHIHSDMSAVIMVLDNPFFAVPDSSGKFAIPGIPPGRYVVTGWHERARAIHQEVTIESGQRTELRLEIPLEESSDGQ